MFFVFTPTSRMTEIGRKFCDARCLTLKRVNWSGSISPLMKFPGSGSEFRRIWRGIFFGREKRPPDLERCGGHRPKFSLDVPFEFGT